MNHPTDESTAADVAGIHAARAQIAAARIRREALMACGRLPTPLRHEPPSLRRLTLPGYALLRELHRGGQGVVYLAIQQSTGREVAIKVLLHGPHAGSAELARFQREVELLSRLKHPNIVTIHDCGRAGEDVYLVMDFVSGQPLDVYVRNAEKSKGQKVEIEDTLRLFAKVCDGVNAAHLRGVIHRDLKPSNILVVDVGEVSDRDFHTPIRPSRSETAPTAEPKILDFGLAKLAREVQEESSAAAMTLTGQFVGSLPWASPEQAEGRSDLLDIRTDVYSLGVILYQLLTGRFPYPVSGRMDDVVRNIVETNPARPSTVLRGIDRDIEVILLKCLAKEPDRRYQSAGELARDVRRHLTGEPIEARRATTLYQLKQFTRRHKALVGSAAAIFVILLGATAGMTWAMIRAQQAEREAKISLGDAYLAEAKALRAGHEVGHRARRLDALGKAATLNESVLELRNEVIAGLAEADLVVDKTYALPPDTLPWRTVVKAGGVAFGTKTADILLRPRLDETAGEYWIAPPEDGDELSMLDFSPDGRYLIVIYQKRYSHNVRLRLWDVALRRWLWELPFAGDVHVLPFDFSPDGESVAVAHPDRVIRYHDLRDGRVRRIIEHGFPVRKVLHLRVGSAGPTLLLADQAKPRLVLWNLEDSSSIELLLPSGALGLSQSQDERWLAVGCFDSRIRVYRPALNSQGRLVISDAATDSQYAILSGHHAVSDVMPFSQDGDLLFTASQDDTVRIWDVPRGRERFAPMSRVTLVGADADRVAVADNTEKALEITLRRLESSSVCRTVRVDWEQPVFIDDRLLAVGGAELTVWDCNSGVKQTTLTDERVTGIRVLADGLLASSFSTGLAFWPFERAGQELRFGERDLIWDHPRVVDRLCVTPDESHAFVADEGDRVLRVPLDDPSAATVLVSQLGARPMDLSADGRRLVVGHWRGTEIVVYSVADGERLFSLETPAAVHAFADFVPQPGGGLLVVSTPDEYRFLDSESYALRHTLARSGWLGYFAVASDGSTALVTRTGGTPLLIDLSSFEVLAELALPEPNCTIKQSAFNPQGTHLVMTTNDNTTFIWDIRAMREHLAQMGLDWR